MKSENLENKLVIIDDTESGNLIVNNDSQITISFTDKDGKSDFSLKISVGSFKKDLVKLYSGFYLNHGQ